MDQLQPTASPSVAILLFSRSAAEEAAVKTFDRRSGRGANRAIAQQFIRKATATARRSGLPVFTCFSTQQSGGRFGERLANAMEAVYARGYAKVIAIGNDCPALSPELLRQAAASLGQRNLVLGPAADGGVYLLGLDHRAFDRTRFLNLPWQNARLQQGFADYASQDQESIHWLQDLRDIDHQADFQHFLREKTADRSLVRALVSILASGLRPPAGSADRYISAQVLSRPTLRAPPF